MKRILLAFFVSTVCLACDKDDDIIPANESVPSIIQFLNNTNGFKIIEFRDGGIDKTNLFSSYQFTFNTNGVVIATRTGETINGTYTVIRDDNKTELKMTFSNNNTFYELTDDWYFNSQSDSTIRFVEDRDVIQFKKL